MKTTILILIFLFVSNLSKSQVVISGKTNAITGETITYTVNWGEVSSWIQIANVTWNVQGGTVVISDKYSATIIWDQVPLWENRSCTVEVTDDLTGSMDDIEVVVENFRVSQSEFCNGFLGPRSVFENFGTGANPGAPLPQGRTNYIYQSNCALTSGFYTLTNSTVGCRNVWLGLQDHTPNDINGYMMMVDGDDRKGEIYRRTATGLLPSFRYELSAWVANLSDPSSFERPKVSFKVLDMSGNVIGVSGNITVEYNPTNPWQQVSFMFDLPIGSTQAQVIVANENNSPNGNDYVIDDISFAPCYSPILASFNNSTLPIVDVTENCNSGSNTLYAFWPTALVPFVNSSFQWERRTKTSATWSPISGATSNTYTQSESSSDIYEYRVKAYETNNPSQFVYSNLLTFFVRKVILKPGTSYALSCNPNPIILTPDFSIINNNPYGSNGLTFNWSPTTNLNNPSISNPTIFLPVLPATTNYLAPAPTIYSYHYNLTVNNSAFVGCNASNSYNVSQSSPRPIAVPTIFHPYSNVAIDKTWKVFNIEDYPESIARVWNRFGQKIFESSGPTALSYHWDGSYQGVLQPLGAYVWQIHINGCPSPIISVPGTPIQTTQNASGTLMLAY